jgi:para-nitrobenzyl esterase
VELLGAADANAYIAEYDKAYPGHTPQEMFYTDLFLRKAAVKMADLKSAQNSADVYMYFFTWKPSTNALGACHGMELPFMFNNIALQREMTGGTLEAYKLADLISSAWISFIRTGNPNVKGLPEWEPYTAENGNTMIFDNECTVLHNHDRGLMKFDLPRHF